MVSIFFVLPKSWPDQPETMSGQHHKVEPSWELRPIAFMKFIFNY
jgi:hypothetical protein